MALPSSLIVGAAASTLGVLAACQPSDVWFCLSPKEGELRQGALLGSGHPGCQTGSQAPARVQVALAVATETPTCTSAGEVRTVL